MLSIILFVMIGIKLDMLHGWYLGLIILYCTLWFINICLKMIKVGMGK